MSKSYRLAMDISVFDEEALMKAAKEHAAKTMCSVNEDFSIEDALITILDPGGGGDAYQGNLNEIGIQIDGSCVESAGLDLDRGFGLDQESIERSPSFG